MRPLSSWRLIALFTSILPLSGCSSLLSMNSGFQSPYSSKEAPGHRGMTLDAHAGLGFDEEIPAGVNASVRTRFAADQQQVALGLGFFGMTPPEKFGAFGRTGVSMLQFEGYDSRFAFGMGSPWVELGGYALPNAFIRKYASGGVAIMVSAQTGYDVRFNADAHNTAWWAATLGVGILATASAP